MIAHRFACVMCGSRGYRRLRKRLRGKVSPETNKNNNTTRVRLGPKAFVTPYQPGSFGGGQMIPPPYALSSSLQSASRLTLLLKQLRRNSSRALNSYSCIVNTTFQFPCRCRFVIVFTSVRFLVRTLFGYAACANTESLRMCSHVDDIA